VAVGQTHEIQYIDFPLLEKHLWAFERDDAWLYPGSDNAWEEAALSLELAEGRGVVGWYRNPISGRAALSIPYYKGNRRQAPTSSAPSGLHLRARGQRRAGR
jgi:hypothetical protein